MLTQWVEAAALMQGRTRPRLAQQATAQHINGMSHYITMKPTHLAFIVTKQPDTFVMYHGTNQTSRLLRNTPIWGGLRQQDASEYSKNGIWVLQNKVPLNLINVMHPSFHDDFIARVNSAFNGIHDYTDQRIYPLATFGLPDLQTQMGVFGKVPSGIYPDSAVGYDDSQRVNLAKVMAYAPLYGNKHRLSLLENDKRTVALMQRLYPDAHGYIADGVWPSYHMGGMFHAEACVFKPTETLQIVKTMAGGRTRAKQVGGGDVDEELRKLCLSFTPNPRHVLTPDMKVVVNPLAYTDQDPE